MNSIVKTLLLFCLLTIAPALYSSACTIFTAQVNGDVLVGNNEDWNSLDNSIRFYPATSKSYGSMLMKIDKNGYPFGGMNDQGLFFDWCALTRRNNIHFPSNRKNYKGTLCEKMLAECSTIDEAIHLYLTYNDPWLYEGHIMIVDKTGASVVIEWGTDSLAVIRKNDRFQLLTNFTLSDPYLAGWYPCWRYAKASSVLKETGTYTYSLFPEILDDVHQEGTNQTIYSDIYNLNKGTLNIFYLHRFDKYVHINLSDELLKGEKYYKIPDIFSQLSLIKPYNQQFVALNEATLTWFGDALNYKLYCSTDSTFSNCNPVLINSSASSITQFLKSPPTIQGISKSGDLNYVVFLLLPLFLFSLKRKEHKLFFLMPLALVLTILISCEKDLLFESIEKGSLKTFNYSPSDLISNTTYYWKIEASNSAGFTTVSKTHSFITE